MKTTLNAIRNHSPCAEGWEKLLKHLGKTKPDDEPLAITTILDSNGLQDAIWCLRAVEGKDREIRLFAVWCARQVQHLLTDKRSLDALDVVERYANGEATEAELAAAWAAAWAAAGAAADAWNATRAAAWSAAEAAWCAARAAARSAANAAAWHAAARSAANAAGTAADAAADAAMYAAKAEMRLQQEAELRRICEEE